MVSVHIKIPLAVKKELQKQAKMEGRSMSNLIRFLLQQTVKEEKGTKKDQV